VLCVDFLFLDGLSYLAAMLGKVWRDFDIVLPAENKI
jgi:hypothetical protein